MKKEDADAADERQSLEPAGSERVTASGRTAILRKGLGLAKVVIINVLLLVLLAELVSVAFYFKRTGQFYYLANVGGAEEAAEIGVDPARLERAVIERLHPYFGFTTKPGTPYKLTFSQQEHRANNYGFATPHAYPFKRRGAQYVVGVFGGSVAQNYTMYEEEHGVLARALKRLPALRDREVVVLPFAYGGYKQPQQLLILNYFLSLGQDLDLVINIDGFNEVALSALNVEAGVEIGMPSIQHVSPLINLAGGAESTEELTSVLRIKQYKESLKEGLEALQNCALASCYSLRLLHVRYLAGGYRREVGKYDQYWAKKFTQLQEDSLVQVNRDESLTPEGPERFARVAALWADSSHLMKQTLAARNVPYYHFIQPNQYHPTRKVFSEEERKVAIQEDGRYVRGARGGYPALLARVEDLRKTGVEVISAANIFDEVQGAVYVDSCCHFNELGENVFATFVAGSITADLGRLHGQPRQ